MQFLDEIDGCLQKNVFVPFAANKALNELLVEEEGAVEDRRRTIKLLEAVYNALGNMVNLQCY